MVSEEDKKKIKEEVEEGKILVRTIIEIVGKPKEHVDKSLKVVVEKIKEQKGLEVVDEKAFSAEPHEKLFSAFVELGILFKNIDSLIGFCFDYMPSSIEIMDPEKIHFNSNEFAAVLNDMVGRLQQINVNATQTNIEKKSLKKNMLNMIRNTVMILLNFKNMNLEQLSKSSGVEEKSIKPLLDSMVEEKVIKLDEGVYSLKKDG
jgi:ketopantoate reductase